MSHGTRVGIGFDAHRFGTDDARPLVLLGVTVPGHPGLAGTSDADVAAHAVADALLGAAALGDIGEHFPSSDERWHGADSMQILTEVVAMVEAAGFGPVNLDVTIVAQSVRVSPHRESMRQRVADITGLDPSAVSVKATSTDGMGFTGADEGIAVFAVAALAGDR